MKNLLLFLCLFGLFSASLVAQKTSDGEPSMQNTNFLGQERNVRYVPVHFHLVADDLGNGKARYSDVFAAFCRMNAYLEPHNIQFFMQKNAEGRIFSENIHSTQVFSIQNSIAQMQAKRVAGALNIFIVGTAMPIGGNVIPGYFKPDTDWIVWSKTYLKDEFPYLMRPIGHFFGLRSTSYGWGEAAFNPLSPGFPLAPLTAPNGQATELADGSNCTTAGDLICDTPPDYGFVPTDMQSCLYNGGAKDPNGTPLSYTMDNLMANIFPNCPNLRFTTDQSTAMLANLDQPNRAYLANTFQPDAPILVPTDWEIQVGGIVNVGEVSLHWSPIQGAVFYEISYVRQGVPISSPLTKHLLVYDTIILIENIQPNVQFDVFVTPRNADACGTPATMGTFVAADVSNIATTADFSSKISLSPNPSRQGDLLQIVCRGEISIQNLSIVDATGRTRWNQAYGNQSKEAHAWEIPTEGLEAGAYLLRVQTAEKVLILRFLVL